jgi:hypothetical protein
MTGLFGCLLISLFWVYFWYFHKGIENGRPTYAVLWLCVTWTPLFWYVALAGRSLAHPLICRSSAAHLASWGLYHAVPNSFSSAPGENEVRGPFKRLLLKPATLNICGGVLPFVQAASVIAPGVVAHLQYVIALDDYDKWLARYGSQTELSQEMLVAAQRIWYAQLRSMKTASTAFFVWAAWAFVLFFVYSILSYRLISVLWTQIAELGRIHANHMRQTVPLNDVTPTSPVGTRQSVPVISFSDDKDERGPTKSGSDATGSHDNEPRLSVSTGRAPSEAPQNFFPSMRPSALVHRTAPKHSPSTSSKERRYLQVVLVHVCIQSFAVGPAILIFDAIATWVAATIYGSSEWPETGLGYMLARVIVAASWTSCIFGTLTLVAIWQRVYEPSMVFTGLIRGQTGPQSSDKAKTARRRNGRPISRTGAPGSPAGETGAGGMLTSLFESVTVDHGACDATMPRMPDWQTRSAIAGHTPHRLSGGVDEDDELSQSEHGVMSVTSGGRHGNTLSAGALYPTPEIYMERTIETVVQHSRPRGGSTSLDPLTSVHVDDDLEAGMLTSSDDEDGRGSSYWGSRPATSPNPNAKGRSKYFANAGPRPHSANNRSLNAPSSAPPRRSSRGARVAVPSASSPALPVPPAPTRLRNPLEPGTAM